MRALVPFYATALLATSPASAPSNDPVTVFRQFGLVGTWSPRCTEPPSLDNPRVTWREANGALLHTVSFDGRTASIEDHVGIAIQVDEATLRFTLVRHGTLLATVTVQRADGYVHTVQSVAANGHVYYDKGVELSTGKPALADEPCSATVS